MHNFVVLKRIPDLKVPHASGVEGYYLLSTLHLSSHTVQLSAHLRLSFYCLFPSLLMINCYSVSHHLQPKKGLQCNLHGNLDITCSRDEMVKVDTLS